MRGFVQLGSRVAQRAARDQGPRPAVQPLLHESRMSRILVCGLLLSVPACLGGDLETARVESPIIGGQLAMSAEFPTVVALENTPGDWFCTGTLIDKDWVLTAAHCIAGETAA